MESGFGSCSKADEHDKAEAAMHEARKALDKSQLLLDTAIDAAEKASAEAKAAADHVKILEEEHGHLVRSLVFHVFFKHASASLGNKYQQMVATHWIPTMCPCISKN